MSLAERHLSFVAVIVAAALNLGAMRPTVAETGVEPPDAVALVISGGVSLGSYEAGYGYMALEQLKKSETLGPLKLVTGASAGSANALFTALQSCAPPNPDPTADLGYRAWIPAGWRELFEPEKTRDDAVFHPGFLEVAMQGAREKWFAGLREDCDVVLGVTTTRVNPISVRLSPLLEVPRQEEKFVLRIQGRGPGVPPKLSNYVDPESSVPMPLVPLEDDGAGRDEKEQAVAGRNFERLTSILFASGAFPLAFPPVTLGYCMTDPNAEAQAPCVEPTEEALFVDGGIFDNNPLRLAHQTARFGLVADDAGKPRWRDVTEPAQAPLESIGYAYLDPDTTSYPLDAEVQTLRQAPGAGPLSVRLASGFVTTARSKELYALIRESPELQRRMRLTVSHYPKASEHLAAFIGFFERGFRVFDFYLGMYDAWVNGRAFGFGQSEIPFDLATPGVEVPEPWRPFACMVGWFEPGREHLRASCEGDDLEQFRVLVQVALDRLYNLWQLGNDLPGRPAHLDGASALRQGLRRRSGAADPRGPAPRGLRHAPGQRRRG